MRKSRLSATLLKVAAGALAATFLAVPERVLAAGSEGLVASDDDLGPADALGDHSTRGIVQSIATSILVISRPHHRGDMTFSLTPSTRREGTIVVGANVSIRYRDNQKVHIATAVAVQRKDRIATDERPD